MHICFTLIEKESNGKGIKSKCIQSELLTMYLIPESSDMQCRKVREMNDDGINRLKTQEQNDQTKSKIRLLELLNQIIQKWIDKNNPLEEAQKLFVSLIKNDHPGKDQVGLRLV